VTFVFVILGLLEVEPVAHRLRRIGNGQFGVAAIDSATEIAARLQTYMLVRLGMSVLTGLAFWAFAALDGIELQREWGVIRFRAELHTLHRLVCRNPAAGSIRGSAIRVALRCVRYLYCSQYPAIRDRQLFEPRVAGTAVAVSPFMVLFAVFFWGMLWGVAGAFIGVPVLIALAAVCTRHPAARPIAILLSSDSGSRDE
jgi:AI-2 transport protein TqsA